MCIVWDSGQDIFFPIWISNCSTPLLSSFSHWFLCCFCKKKKIHWLFNIELISDLFCFICLSSFVLISYCLDYCFFIVTTEIRQCKSSKLIFSIIFFHFFFCYSVIYIFKVYFSSSFSISTKKFAGNLFGIALNIDKIWGECTSLPILSQNVFSFPWWFFFSNSWLFRRVGI